jgi:hypothetical protein
MVASLDRQADDTSLATAQARPGPLGDNLGLIRPGAPGGPW